MVWWFDDLMVCCLVFGSLKIGNLEIESWKYDIRKCGNWKFELVVW